MNHRVLIIQDEAQGAQQLAALLHREGYDFDRAADGLSGLAKAMGERFDLILLDTALPGRNGYEVCRILRHGGNRTPIVLLHDHRNLQDLVQGLKLGADDLVVKPYSETELLARMEALLRRAQWSRPLPGDRFRFGDVAVDFERNNLHKNGSRVGLAGKELELLRYLVVHLGQVVSRDELLETVWRYQPGVSSRTVDVHVAQLRQKLEDDPQAPRHIQTVRGAGYRFCA